MNSINNEKEDRYWTVEEIRPYIIKELQKRFPDSIIEREFCDIDIMVHGPNIPVEIQRIYLDSYGYVKISTFEDNIRRQIDANIEISGCCWLFFDAKLLNHLQNNLTRYSVINMDWLYRLFESGKLRVFTITINGIIRELEDIDFEFIRNFSATCKLSRDEEHRILERNKSKITYNIYKDHGFTTDEINHWYDEYEKNTQSLKFIQWLRRGNSRMSEFAKIKSGIANITMVNDMLKCNSKERKAVPHSYYLGILEGDDLRYRHSRTRCSDSHNILQYLPGYLINKELWDYWKIYTVDTAMFSKIIRGEYPNYLKDRNSQKNIEDSWN